MPKLTDYLVAIAKQRPRSSPAAPLCGRLENRPNQAGASETYSSMCTHPNQNVACKHRTSHAPACGRLIAAWLCRTEAPSSSAPYALASQRCPLRLPITEAERICRPVSIASKYCGHDEIDQPLPGCPDRLPKAAHRP